MERKIAVALLTVLFVALQASAHEHHPPHKGTLVEFGEEFAHLELVLDPATGKLTAYALDGEAEKAVRLKQTEIVVETAPDNAIVTGLKLLTGKLLSVFPSGRPVKMTTRVASIGIRGTGVYMESDPEQTYFCTCYGVADIGAINDPTSKETVAAQHHDRPLYILGNEPAGKNIRNAPFINHTDQELMLIETLVGRTPPFVFPNDQYKGQRPGYR